MTVEIKYFGVYGNRKYGILHYHVAEELDTVPVARPAGENEETEFTISGVAGQVLEGMRNLAHRKRGVIVVTAAPIGQDQFLLGQNS